MIGTDIEQQQALTVVGQKAIIHAVVGDRPNAAALTTRRSNSRDRLLARIKARRADREIGNVARGKAVLA